MSLLLGLIGSVALAQPLTTSFEQGRLVMRTADDSLWLSPGARLQIDAYATFPAGPPTQVLMRRVRPELSGGLYGDAIEFTVTGEFAGEGAVADAWIRWRTTPWLFVQVGKFNVPFGLEHQVSDRYIGFIERSMVQRNLGAGAKQPGVQLMAWDRDARVTGQVGLFMANAEADPDDQLPLDLISRFTLRPFGAGDLERVQIGGSLSVESPRSSPWSGGVNREGAGSVRTPSGWTFVPNTYAAADGKGTPIDLVPRGGRRFAFELAAPAGRIEARAEGMLVHAELEERDGTVAVRRDGSYDALGGVVSLALWATGPIDPLPEGRVPKPSLDRVEPQRKPSLQLLIRGEALSATYDAGVDTGPSLVGGSQASEQVGIVSGAFQANLWWGPNIRLSTGVAMYSFDAQQVETPVPGQSALVEFNSRAAVAF